MIGIHLDWGHVALYTLGICLVYLPFAYKFALDQGDGHPMAILHVLVFYLLASLWIVGGALVLIGLGMVVDRPTESCGIGCIEPGQSHWEGFKVGPSIVGAGLVLMAWLLGKGVERFVEQHRARRAAAVDPEQHRADVERLFAELSASHKLTQAAWQKHKRQAEETDAEKTEDVIHGRRSAPERKSDIED